MTGQEAHAKLKQRIAERLRLLPAIIGNEVVNFAIVNFEQEAFSGNSQQPWPKRKSPTKWGKIAPTGKLLVKSGFLKAGVRIIDKGDNWVRVGNSVPYARVHNYGFKGPVKQQVKPFTRTVKGKPQKVQGFSRTINQNIPRRQFLSEQNESPYLNHRIRRACLAEIRHAIKGT